VKLRLPRIIARDLWRKSVALFFAVLIWFAIDAELHESYTLRNVPVDIQYDPSELVVEDAAVSVDVTLRGSRKRLQSVSSNDIRVSAEVPDHIPPGIYFYPLGLTSKNVVHTPPGVRVSDVTPQRIDIRVDRIVTKRNVPVRVRFEGDLREGFKRTRSTAIPSSVDIKGPNRILKDVTELVTEPVLLDETVVQDFEVDVKLVPIPRVVMPSQVHVTVEISRHSSQKALQNLTMFLLANPDSTLKLKEPLPKASVTLQGPKTVLDAMDESSVRPFIDVSAISNPGRYRRPVQVSVEGGSSVTQQYVHPASVEIELVEPENAPETDRPPPEPPPAAPAPAAP
jgi:YbbR domain-containing protein